MADHRPPSRLRTRLLTVIVAGSLAVWLIERGELWYFLFVTVILTVAVVEFCWLMRRGGSRLSFIFATALLWVLLLDAQFPDWSLLGPGVSLVMMGSLTWRLAHREGNRLTDWALGMAGPLYVGWYGAHIIRLRNMPAGLWWTMTALPTIWCADGGAYLIGRAMGRHRLCAALSPGKTWEGWAGGAVIGALAGAGLAALWGLRAGPQGPSAVEGLVLGLIVGTVAPLGDLVISMIKREVGAKDTGFIFPGHGGALDRVDSVLWAGVIGYYFAVWIHGL
ncbi:MAG: CDP-archaeol synthase [Anaerolineae bacterium]